MNRTFNTDFKNGQKSRGRWGEIENTTKQNEKMNGEKKLAFFIACGYV